MLTCNTLRIDRGDDSSAVDYRIENGRVEMRTLETGSGWQHVTPEQLSAHILSNTVVAQWLRRKMRVRQLLRACQNTSVVNSAVQQQYRDEIAA